MKTIKAEKNAVKSKYIVGIGASAGGLEALQKLLEALPSNTGFPFIIVQHLSPDYKSLLSENSANTPICLSFRPRME